MPRRVVVVCGPTATGKTKLAVALAHRLQGEVVSADSMQVYKNMPVGTAVPTLEEREGIPHHLMECVFPAHSFSVAQYQAMAEEAFADIHARGKTVILCGGTGLYIDAVMFSRDFPPVDPTGRIRAEMEALMLERGTLYLHNQLVKMDSVAAEAIHPRNTRRVIRALEVIRLTNRPFSSFVTEPYSMPRYPSALWMGLDMEREKLYDRINQRVEAMLEKGWLEEAKALFGVVPANATAMQGLGYKELVQFLEGNRTLAETTAIIQMETRRYAKRQLTWFRRNPNILWYDADDYTIIDKIMQKNARTPFSF